MFKSSKGPERHDDAAATERQPQAMVSCIGAGMTIVGTIDCRGPAQIYGRVEGEVRATELVIGEGAEVEGTIEAEDVVISGHVRGTIRALRVKLQGASVEGEIVHRTLSMDERSVFEGSSRRAENPLEQASNGGKPVAKGPSLELVPSAAVAG